MKNHSGRWIGTFITSDGRAVQVTVKLDFDDDGSFAGEFRIYPSYPENDLRHWHGPTEGRITKGGYSPFGTIHFEEQEDPIKYGEAAFNGRYEAPKPRVGVIWGSVRISMGSVTEVGILTLVYAEPPPINTSLGVWGE